MLVKMYSQLDLIQFIEFKDKQTQGDKYALEFWSIAPDGFKMPLELSVEAFKATKEKTVDNVLISLNKALRLYEGIV